MSNPLVSIICICHNQANYLQEALDSVRLQNYQPIQFIVVDDGSTDGSAELLREWQQSHLSVEILLLPKSMGYCRAFNKGWRLAQGEFIIDLSADDVLLPHRVQAGVKALQWSSHGVNFCDAAYIDSHSQLLGTHYRRDERGKLLTPVPQGFIYRELLRKYFICAPTMMIKRVVLEQLDGYDEALYYEDFDFWIRSSRSYSYVFTDEILVKKRVHAHSMSKSQYTPDSKMLKSTAVVLAKAYHLNQSWDEHSALAARIHYEMRQAVICNQYEVAEEMLQVLRKIAENSWEYKLWKWVIARKWNISALSRFIRKPL